LISEAARAHLWPVSAGVKSEATAATILGPDPKARFSLAMGQLYGIAAARHLIAPHR